MGWIIFGVIMLLVILFLLFWCAVLKVSGKAWEAQERLFEQKSDNHTSDEK